MQPEEFVYQINRLTNHQWRLLEVLIKANNGWVSRRQIAKGIDKRRLIPYDISCLQALHEGQLIDIEHIQDDTPIGYQVVYRISQQALVAIEQLNQLRQETGIPWATHQ
ncbi:MAG: hypothetical protein ACOYL5_18220 [Phototrophicaceae bacterium]|jgi:hypothetical protein